MSVPLAQSTPTDAILGLARAQGFITYHDLVDRWGDSYEKATQSLGRYRLQGLLLVFRFELPEQKNDLYTFTLTEKGAKLAAIATAHKEWWFDYYTLSSKGRELAEIDAASEWIRELAYLENFCHSVRKKCVICGDDATYLEPCSSCHRQLCLFHRTMHHRTNTCI